MAARITSKDGKRRPITRRNELDVSGRDVPSRSTMSWMILFLAIFMDIQPLKAETLNKTEVVALLYDKVLLPCSFPFIQGSEGLSVVWERKDKDGEKSIIAYKFIDGQDKLTDQHRNYTGRTELSREFSQGKADLILQGVTFSDEGTYYCRAANIKGHGQKEVKLTISDKTEVRVPLYAQATLPCSFTFIQGSEDLSVVWERKDKDVRKYISTYELIDGQDKLADQDIDYTGRTELSREFSQGKADLILQGVTFSDEGTYFCRAANIKGHGQKEVKLAISGLNAGDVTVTVVHIDGKKRLKCMETGVFRNPWVKWYDIQGKDLSEYGTRNITVLGDGRKMVESVLELDAETNKHYVCQVKEGRLKRSARAVISDGETVTVPETKPPDGELEGTAHL